MRSKDVLVGRAVHDLRQQRRGKRIGCIVRLWNAV